ncbi:hypothetical protein Acsp05_41400 [Actinokineospora sp. NBRC 105648]|nr:hypothetical protein Acsp05_41400 [Actinokineospora sp. NBRC 105648]
MVALALLAALVTGCSTPVTGSASGTSTGSTTTASKATASSAEVTTTARRPTASRPTVSRQTVTRPTTTTPGVDLTVDESAPSQYCDRPFKGALGKDMLAVVVETPTGRLNCEQAAAILFDYYAARPDPKTGQAPFEIGPMACNQVPEGSLPQVVCKDEDNTIYSMWPQR